jgi:NADPH2:quinone reductase
MRAWLMDSYEGVEKLRLGEIEDPKPGPGDVLLRVKFAALNPADAFLAQSLYPARPPLPHILGRDGVGEVLDVGQGVANVKPGDIVGILRCDVGVHVRGTLAEKAVAPAVSLAPVPAGWSPEEMAAAPLVFLTAWQALTQWSDPPAPPAEGSVTLITGASGGVGVASLLLAKSMRLITICLSRNENKRARLRELGADYTFDPADKNLAKTVLAALAPKRVDLAIDNAAGELFTQVVAMLGYGGRVSVVGRSGGPVPEFNTGALFFRRNRIGGVAVGDYTPASSRIAWTEIVTRLERIGRRPVIDNVFPFEQAREAFARLAQGPMGKVLVRVAG